MKIDPSTEEISFVGQEFEGDFKWAGAVKGPDGQIYGIPYNAASVLRIDPKDDTVATFGHLVGEEKWYGGALGEDGSLYGVPGQCLPSLATVKIVMGTWNLTRPPTIPTRSVLHLDPEDQPGDTRLRHLW